MAWGLVLLSACNYDPDNVASGSRAQSEAMLAQATIPDITQRQPIALSGNVELIGFGGEDEPVDVNDRDATGSVREYRLACEAICAALLATPGVKSVTVVSQSASATRDLGRTFHIVPKARCSRGTVMPLHPDQLDLDRPKVAPVPATRSIEEVRASDQRDLARNVETLETAWKIRLATTDCIRADPVRDEFDFVIKQTHESNPSNPDTSGDACQATETFPVWIDRLELLDRSGGHLLRFSHAATNALALPLHKDLCGSIGGVIPGIGWKRVAIETGAPVRVVALIASHTNLRTTADPVGTRAAVSQTLRNALDNHRLPANDPAFSLAEPYMQLLASGAITPADRSMLVDMIRDERVVAFGELWRVTKALGADSGFLRAPIVERLGRANTNREAANILSGQIRSLPVARLGEAVS